MSAATLTAPQRRALELCAARFDDGSRWVRVGSNGVVRTTADALIARGLLLGRYGREPHSFAVALSSVRITNAGRVALAATGTGGNR